MVGEDWHEARRTAEESGALRVGAQTIREVGLLVPLTSGWTAGADAGSPIQRCRGIYPCRLTRGWAWSNVRASHGET